MVDIIAQDRRYITVRAGWEKESGGDPNRNKKKVLQIVTYMTWLIIDMYSCRLKACSPQSPMAAVALAPKNGSITLA